MQKKQKQNNPDSASPMQKMRRSIRWQAGLALVTVVLTLVLVFSMTAAWYTNVVQSGGLILQTESWGFEGEIHVDQTPVQAAPGDGGVIGLEVHNTNADPAAVSIGVSKGRMDPQMQQRLYFYVDAPMLRNGETMERVYINSRESYTYTLLEGESLLLSEERHTDALLKWHWVYDVLGYYVLGTWSSERNTLTAVDYLRPIEYDYDRATTTFRQEGESLTMELETVDGVTGVEEFLVKLSETDGYPGQIDPSSKLGTGYYPVAVDESGYGVYAYLCTYSDITLATQYDTALAQAEKNAAQSGQAGASYEAKLQVCAQKREGDVQEVSSLSQLESLLEQKHQVFAKLTGDLTTAETLVLPKGTSLTLDLNGYTLTGTSEGKILEAQQGSSLMLLNGTVTGSAYYGIHGVGSRITCHQVEIKGFPYSVYVSDSGSQLDSVVRLVDCEISGDTCAVFVSGNGTGSEQKSQLVVDGCTLTGKGMLIASNGTATGEGRWGTDIQVLNSTLTCDPDAVTTAIYHPQKDSTLTVYRSTVSAYTGIAIKGGHVRIQGSSVTGTGEKNPPAYASSGFADTGDGIYIEANYGEPILLEIDKASVSNETAAVDRESVISSEWGYSLQVFEPDVPWVTVRIYSGEFDEEQAQNHMAEGTYQKKENGKYLIRRSDT